MEKLAFDLHHHEDIEPCQKCHAGCKYYDMLSLLSVNVVIICSRCYMYLFIYIFMFHSTEERRRGQWLLSDAEQIW